MHQQKVAVFKHSRPVKLPREPQPIQPVQQLRKRLRCRPTSVRQRPDVSSTGSSSTKELFTCSAKWRSAAWAVDDRDPSTKRPASSPRNYWAIRRWKTSERRGCSAKLLRPKAKAFSCCHPKEATMIPILIVSALPHSYYQSKYDRILFYHWLLSTVNYHPLWIV